MPMVMVESARLSIRALSALPTMAAIWSMRV
jgi:hypothetical protein